MTTAQTNLDSLYTEATATDLASAQLSLASVQISYQQALDNLDKAVLRTPISGTVMSVNAVAGTQVGTSAIMTIADMDAPLLEFWVEETDMAAAQIGNKVNVVFEALPDLVYTGTIVQVDPALVTVGNTPAAQAWARLELAANQERLLSGMAVQVEVIQAEARNVLLVPLEALRTLGKDQYAVFVVGTNGELELRPVEVGLQDLVNRPALLLADEPTGNLDTSYEEALPAASQFVLGTFLLEDTPNAVTPEQAKALLPLWQALQSGAAQSSAEVNALLGQIERAMTTEQRQAIAALRLTREDLAAWAQDRGMDLGQWMDGPGGTPGARPGGTPGVWPRGTPRAGREGGFDSMSAEERAQLMATMQAGGMPAGGPAGGFGGRAGQGQTNLGQFRLLLPPLIELLTQRAGSWLACDLIF